MALMTSCFANASFAVMFEKIVRTIVDTLMPPLSPTELTAGYVLSSTTRGLLVGLAVGVAMTFFVPLHIHAWGFVIFHAVSAALFMSSTGLITALWAEKVDHVASITNFVVLPHVPIRHFLFHPTCAGNFPKNYPAQSCVLHDRWISIWLLWLRGWINRHWDYLNDRAQYAPVASAGTFLRSVIKLKLSHPG